jgi:hypothetical protein
MAQTAKAEKCSVGVACQRLDESHRFEKFARFLFGLDAILHRRLLIGRIGVLDPVADQLVMAPSTSTDGFGMTFS